MKLERRWLRMASSGTYTKKELPQSVLRLGIILLVSGLVIGLATFALDSKRAVFNYLLSFVFLLTIGLGSLFLIALEYVSNAAWSTPFRRVAEFFSSYLPVLLFVALPLFLFLGDLYHWTHPAPDDKILTGKLPYLNIPFFIIRVIACFAIWIIYYLYAVRNSRKQDETKDQTLTRKNLVASAIFIPLFAITATIASVDWLMSLEPHWFSTIFGVYFFSGSVVASLAAITYTVVKLREKGYLHTGVVNDHYYSFGSLLFGFVNFWAYIAFSQFMLYWYANLPEETFWFINRWAGYWPVISIGLIIVHFIVPYAILLPQPAKMDPKRLKFASLWLLFAHLIDLYWLIMPQYHSDKNHPLLYILEIGFPMAIIGAAIIIFYLNFKKHNAVPVGDPKLQRGLDYRV